MFDFTPVPPVLQNRHGLPHNRYAADRRNYERNHPGKKPVKEADDVKKIAFNMLLLLIIAAVILFSVFFTDCSKRNEEPPPVAPLQCL